MAQNISNKINIFSKDDLLISVANKFNKKTLNLDLLWRQNAYQKNSKAQEKVKRDAFFRQFKASFK